MEITILHYLIKDLNSNKTFTKTAECYDDFDNLSCTYFSKTEDFEIIKETEEKREIASFRREYLENLLNKMKYDGDNQDLKKAIEIEIKNRKYIINQLHPKAVTITNNENEKYIFDIRIYIDKLINTKTLGEIEVDEILTKMKDLERNIIFVYCSEFAETLALSIEEFLEEINVNQNENLIIESEGEN
jgi:hypothetical protein